MFSLPYLTAQFERFSRSKVTLHFISSIIVPLDLSGELAIFEASKFAEERLNLWNSIQSASPTKSSLGPLAVVARRDNLNVIGHRAG